MTKTVMDKLVEAIENSPTYKNLLDIVRVKAVANDVSDHDWQLAKKVILTREIMVNPEIKDIVEQTIIEYMIETGQVEVDEKVSHGAQSVMLDDLDF